MKPKERSWPVNPRRGRAFVANTEILKRLMSDYKEQLASPHLPFILKEQERRYKASLLFWDRVRKRFPYLKDKEISYNVTRHRVFLKGEEPK
jgi:hypothetical protein